MKEWFGFRLGIIGVASLFVYYTMQYIISLWVRLSPAQLQSYILILISLTWVIGLIVLKWQFDHMPSEEQKKPFDWKQPFQQHQNKSANPGSPTLLEQATHPKNQNNPSPPGPSGIREVPGKGVTLGNITEGLLGGSQANAELCLDLEVPEDTTVEVYGTDYKVKKGSLKIRPVKSKEQKLQAMFPSDRTRKRKRV